MLARDSRSLCMVPCSQPCDTMLLRVAIPGCTLPASARAICKSASGDELLGAALTSKGSGCLACRSLRKAAVDGVLCARGSSSCASCK